MTAPNSKLAPIVSFIQRVWADNETTVSHAIGMTITILAMWEVSVLLKLTLGEDAKLFGCIPFIYLSHFGDLLAIVQFYWNSSRKP